MIEYFAEFHLAAPEPPQDPLVDISHNLRTEPVELAGPVEPVCVAATASIRTVFEVLKRREARGSVLVCVDGRLAGIFTERDALRLMAAGGDLDRPIEAAMTKNPVALTQSATVGEAVRRMSEGGYRRLPIVDAQNRPVGLLTVGEIVHYLVAHFPKMVYNLPPAPRPAMQQREGP